MNESVIKSERLAELLEKERLLNDFVCVIEPYSKDLNWHRSTDGNGYLSNIWVGGGDGCDLAKSVIKRIIDLKTHSHGDVCTDDRS